MELVGSSSLASRSLILGGGGGGGGRMVVVVGDEVEDETMPPEGTRNSFASLLKTMVEVCMV